MQQHDTLAMSLAAWMGYLIYLRLSIRFGSPNRIVKIVRSSLLFAWAVIHFNKDQIISVGLHLPKDLLNSL